MPSTTRGSILISTANDIGEALVEKLGGVGYSPNEWKEKYNLCGIAPVDSAPALSVLADSAGTGDERGSILIATADAIGAILNKKYNVLRGFKPKEWASACRKMKALEEGSVASASIASFSDGADTVPLTSCVCSIDANLDGKTAVNAVHTRKNLVNSSLNEQGSINATTGANVNSDKRIRTTYIKINANTTYSISIGGSVNLFELYQYKTDGTLARAYIAINAQTYTFTSHADAVSIRFSMRYADNSVIQTSAIENLQLEQSSEPTTYEEYSAETKTADLGRAVYGGSADIIKGEGVDNCTNRNLVGEGFTWTYNTTELSFPYFTIGSNAPNKAANKNFVCDGYVNSGNYRSFLQDGEIGVFNNTTGINRFCIRDDSCTTLEQFLEKNANTKITYEVTNPTDFTFEPVKIDSFPGVNNIWNDCGDTAVEYYKSPTPYTRKTATGGIANFSDQRTDLPLTKAIANIAPSIAGKSAVNLYQGKKNLVDGTSFTRGLPSTTIGASIDTIIASNRYEYFDINTGGEVMTVSSVTNDIDKFNLVLIFGYKYGILTYYSNTQPGTDKTVDFTDCDFIRIGVGAKSGETVPTDLTDYGTIQLEVGPSASTYEPYQAPTTYTAELGETVYGGSVDFVSGEVNKEYGMITFDGSSDENWLYSDAYGWFYIDNHFGDAYRNNSESDFMICNLGTQSPYVSVASLADLHFACTSLTHSRFAFKNSQYSTVEDFKTWLSNNNMIVVYKLATPTESAIPGRVISPIEGVNNYWNDAGGDTEIQYFENEA